MRRESKTGPNFNGAMIMVMKGKEAHVETVSKTRNHRNCASVAPCNIICRKNLTLVAHASGSLLVSKRQPTAQVGWIISGCLSQNPKARKKNHMSLGRVGELNCWWLLAIVAPETCRPRPKAKISIDDSSCLGYPQCA